MLPELSSRLAGDYLFNPDQRLYWAYLAGAAALATVFVVADKRRRNWREYWLGREARTDYVYFFTVWLIKAYLLYPLILSAKTVALTVLGLLSGIHAPWFIPAPAWSVSLTYTTALFVMGELTRYWLHRWLHTVPLLWYFHKVHHSAELLHPLTFYRVHPVENLLFGIRYAVSAGMVTGVFIWLFGAGLSLWQIGSANAILWLFGLLGSNLRHSHIYLRYPAMVERWLMSPAQHQIHHSRGASQYNYGGYLSIFDRLFGSLKISPKTPPKQYGLVSGSPYRNIVDMLLRPFVDALSLRRFKS